MNRSAAREETFKLLYSLEVQKKEEIQEQVELYLESQNITNKESKEYISSTVLGIEKNIDTIKEKNKIIQYNIGNIKKTKYKI